MSSTTYFYDGDGNLVEASSSSDEVIQSVTYRDEVQRLSGKSRRQLASLYMRGEIDAQTFEAWVSGAHED